MGPDEYYNKRITALKNDLKLLNKKRKALAWFRFAVVAGIAACCYFLLPFGLLFCIVPGILLLVLFTRLVFADLSNKSLIEHTTYLLAANEDELKPILPLSV